MTRINNTDKSRHMVRIESTNDITCSHIPNFIDVYQYTKNISLCQNQRRKILNFNGMSYCIVSGPNFKAMAPK